MGCGKLTMKGILKTAKAGIGVTVAKAGYIVEFQHPMYFFPSLGQPP
jgi:hypothetical protein